MFNPDFILTFSARGTHFPQNTFECHIKLWGAEKQFGKCHGIKLNDQKVAFASMFLKGSH